MAESVSPGRPLRAALVGCGAMGWGYDREMPGMAITHASAYAQHSDTQLVAVCDLESGAAEACGAAFGVPAYVDVEEMLQDVDVDVVSISTPTATHLELLERCAAAPVAAVWCEKPIAAFGQDPTEVIERYSRAGRILAVNYLRRWEPAHVRLGRGIAAGRFGRIERAVATYSKGFLHSGSHFLDIFRAWFGPVRRTQVLDSRVDVFPEDPNLDVLLEFESGTLAYLLAVDDRSFSMDEIDLFASRGRIRIVDDSRRILWHRRVREPLTGAPGLDRRPRVRRTSFDRVMLAALDDIVTAVRTGSAPKSDGASALETFRICETIARPASAEATVVT